MRALLMTLALAFAGCANEGPPRLYNNNDLSLVAANAARFGCSCVFVMNMTEEFCRAWTKENPDLGRFSVDYAKKRVEGSCLITWSASAQWVDEKHGCILE